ncbi:MAG TPA: malonyl-ACP O-methyltransferase BioC [Steroidobacteraceae bacterium]|nr:malonyl-ACP O-methyltransferase BioC [Steroidobacteraceae bacterium]
MKAPVQDDSEFQLDLARIRRSFGQAAASYDAVAVLQTEVRRRHLERLDFVRLDPRVVLDVGSGTGAGTLALKRRYPRARVAALDLAMGMLMETGRRQTVLRRFARVCGDAARLPFGDGTAELIFSNLMLQWCNDQDAVLREFRRVLAPGGLLSFTTFGPDTLKELRQAWSVADGYTHVNRFVDMHDLGDALVRSGLAEPVLDVERYTLTYAGVRELMMDLKAMGARNANAGRPRGLTGKRSLARMIDSYEQLRGDGRLPASFEVVYGQAWGPVGSRPDAGGNQEFRVPVQRVGRRGRG